MCIHSVFGVNFVTPVFNLSLNENTSMQYSSKELSLKDAFACL